MMFEGLFLAVAGSVFSYVIEKLEPADQIKKWLRREPSTLAFQKALSRAYTAFARQYPEYVASLFDKSFLTRVGAPELAKLLTRHLDPDPNIFAQTWAEAIGFDINSKFAIQALRPATDFLKWLEAELKSEAVFQPIFDSRALESLPNLENQIEKLTTELRRGLEAALKAANEYEKVILEIGGDVNDSNIVVGDYNQVSVTKVYNNYYNGAFATLNDYYIAPDAVLQRVRIEEFIGRDWLAAKVDDFLNNPHNKSGIFLLVGEAGVGKTSFMAHLVKDRRYLHLFAEQIPGDANLQRALQSLGSQLVTRYQIDPYKDRDTLTQLAAFPDFLDKLLRLAANTLTKDEKIVIVCDALDEAGIAPDGNVFGLPNVLPDNVYLILSQRPVSTKLPNINTQTITLEAQGSENLQDMQDYLNAVTKRPEIAGQLRSKNYSDEFFIRTLKEKSLGVWMYLHYIIEEVAKGSRAPLELENLPTGLVGYYADYWSDWREGKNGRGDGLRQWDALYAPLLTTLAVAQQPITIEQIRAWAGVQASEREITRLLQENWRSFLTIRDSQNGKLYAPYHASFRDFLIGTVETSKLRPGESYLVQELAEQSKEAHQRIVKVFKTECNGDWQVLVEHDYPRLYLTTHLASAGEFEELIHLLTEGDEHIAWAEARYQKEETYAGYLNDLAYVWKYAEEKENYALLIRSMLIENSIRTLAGNIPPLLIAELGKTGMWSYARCLTMIKQSPDSMRQTEAIIHLAPVIPTTLQEEIISIACMVKYEGLRAQSFVEIAPHLDDQLKTTLLSSAREIKEEGLRAWTFVEIASHLDNQLKTQVVQEAFSVARQIKDEDHRAQAFVDITPHLDDQLKAQVLEEALSAARQINGESRRARLLAEIAPHIDDQLKAEVLEEALSIARQIEDEDHRAQAFVDIASHLDDQFKAQVLEEALSIARQINEESRRARLLSTIAPHLNDQLKAQVLQEALSAARQIKWTDPYARAIAAIAPHLNDQLKAQVLQKALSAARQIEEVYLRAFAMSEIAPHLDDQLKIQVLQEALSATRQIHDEYSLTRALVTLALYLDDQLKAQVLEEALSTARQIDEESARAHLLVEIVPHLDDQLKAQVLQEALSAARQIDREDRRANLLAAIAPHLDDQLRRQVLEEALSAARQIDWEYDRARLLVEIAPHLDDQLRKQVLEEALSAARQIDEEDLRVGAISEIAPHLDDELKAQVLQEALSAARQTDWEYDRARLLAAIVPHLDNQLKAQVLQEVLSAARQISEYNRVEILAALAPHLDDELKAQVLQEALSAARQIEDDSSRAGAFSEIAPHLDDELKAQVLEEALSAACQITDEEYLHARELSKIPIAFKGEKTISILWKVFLMDLGKEDLQKILSEWEKIQFSGLQERLIQFLRSTSYGRRSDGLAKLAILLPVFVHFQGKEISGEILRAVKDTARWWP